MSWTDFRSRIISEVSRELWDHWSALGVGSSEEARTRAVDLEALLIGTWSFGRTQPRLFDEALSWCCRFGEHLNAKRLEKLLDELDDPVTRRIAEAWACVVRHQDGELWDLAPLPDEDSIQVLSVFLSDELQPQPTGANRDDIFGGLGLLRGPFSPRTTASAPNLSDPRLSQLFARKLMGSGCRAEVFARLLDGLEATTTDLADIAVYSRRLVQEVLGDLKTAGLLDWNPRRGRSTRPTMHEHARNGFRTAMSGRISAGERRTELAVRDWPGFFLGLHALWQSCVRISKYELDGFKAESVLRDGLESAYAYHSRTDIRSVPSPRLEADSMDELVEQANRYIDALFPAVAVDEGGE